MFTTATRPGHTRGVESVAACTLDCPDGCSLLVEVAAGRVARVRGNPDHPITQGRVCPRPSILLDLASSHRRILYPTLREKGRRRRISWERALSLVCERVVEAGDGGKRCLAILGHGSTGVTRHAVKHVFRSLGFAETVGSICDEAGIQAFRLDTGELEMGDPRQLSEAGGILLWGKDPSASAPHVAHRVREAALGGTPVGVISPRRIDFSRGADFDLRIRPGGDLSLAVLACRLLLRQDRYWKGAPSRSDNFEEFRRMVLAADEAGLLASSGLDGPDAERLADFLVRRQPVALVVGQGLQRYPQGCSAVRAINALTFLSGNVGVRGAGSFYNLPSSRNLELSWMARKRTGGMSLPRLAGELEEAADVAVVWVGAANPVNQVPDSLRARRAFERVPFTVAMDSLWNDTAEAADLVLPAAIMFERTDVTATFGHDFLAWSPALVSPPGEARSDFEVADELARRLGPDPPWGTLEEYLSLALSSPVVAGGLPLLRERGFLRAGQPLVAYQDCRFPRPGGMFHFLDSLPQQPRPREDFPFFFLTTVQAAFQHSQIPPERQEGPLAVALNPAAALRLGLTGGSAVSVVSPIGTLPAVLRIDEGLHPEVVAAPRGGWMSMGRGVNAVVEPHLTEEGHTAAYYWQRVSLEPA